MRHGKPNRIQPARNRCSSHPYSSSSRCALARSIRHLGAGNEGKDTWSAFVILGHLIVGERTDWLPRVRIILEHGEARAFDPFDRFAQKEVKDKTLEQLLDEFARLRKENLAALQGLSLKRRI